jgi:hypothetical protein
MNAAIRWLVRGTPSGLDPAAALAEPGADGTWRGGVAAPPPAR